MKNKDMIELLSKFPGDAELWLKNYDNFLGLHPSYEDNIIIEAVFSDEKTKDATKIGVKTDVKELIFS